MAKYNPQQLVQALGKLTNAILDKDKHNFIPELNAFHQEWISEPCQYYIKEVLGKLLPSEEEGLHFFGKHPESPSFVKLFTSARQLGLYSQLHHSYTLSQRQKIMEKVAMAKTSLDYLLLVSEGNFSGAVKTLSR